MEQTNRRIIGKKDMQIKQPRRVKLEKWETKKKSHEIAPTLESPHALMQGEEAMNKIGHFSMIKKSILQ